MQFGYQEIHCDLQFRLDALKDPRLFHYTNLATKEWEESLKGSHLFLKIDVLLVKFSVISKIKTGMKSFTGMSNYFKWMSIYVIPETFRAMFLVVGECLKVEKMSLFTKSYGIKHITLDEFEGVQTQCTNNVTSNSRNLKV